MPTNEPQPQKGTPQPPASLKGEAMAEWQRIVPELARIGLVALIDRAALVVYCRAWQTYCDAIDHLEEYGPVVESGRDGGMVKNPSAQIARDAADLMLRYGSRFGFTPSDRVRLAVPADEGAPPEDVASILS